MDDRFFSAGHCSLIQPLLAEKLPGIGQILWKMESSILIQYKETLLGCTNFLRILQWMTGIWLLSETGFLSPSQSDSPQMWKCLFVASVFIYYGVHQTLVFPIFALGLSKKGALSSAVPSIWCWTISINRNFVEYLQKCVGNWSYRGHFSTVKLFQYSL